MKSPNPGKTPRRGEIWWATFDPAIGSEIRKTRPCVVLTTNVLNERRRTIVAVPLSSSPKAAPPLLVRVQCGGRIAVAVVDQVRALARERFVKRIELLSAAHLEAVENALREILDLD
jgi:mRNA interferase MazF